MKERKGKINSPSHLSSILSQSIFLLTILALLITGISQIFISTMQQREYIKTSIQAIAEKAAVSFDSFIEIRIQALKNASWLADIGSVIPEEQVTILSRIIGNVDSLQKAAFFDRNGNLTSEIAMFGPTEPQQLTVFVQDNIPELKETGRPRFGEIHIDEQSNESHLLILVPVYDVFDDFQGVLAAELSLRFMWEFIGGLEIEKDGYAYIVDRKGLLLAHSDITRVLSNEDLSGAPIVRSFIEGDEQQINLNRRYTGINGEPVVGMYVAMDTIDWAVVTEFPWDSSYRQIFIQALGSLLFIVAAALGASLLGTVIARRIAAPISDLTRTAEKISRGAMELQADIQGPQEVRSLAAAFNRMTGHLQKARSRLETLIDYSPTSIIVIDRKDIVELWNRASANLYGWQSHEIVGRVLPIVPSYRMKDYQEKNRRIIEKQESLIDQEVPYLRKDGSEGWILMSAAPLMDESARVERFMIIAVDISEQKRDREQLIASLREKEVLLKEVHHRVKNNMQIISSILYLQEISLQDPQLISVFRASQQRIKSMGIIHEQLYLSDNLARIDFQRYIETLSRDLLDSYIVEASHIHVSFDIPTLSLSMETAVPCGLIVNELLTNAIKHAFSDGRQGEIKVEMKAIGNGDIELTVSDDGVGMSDEAEIENEDSLGLSLVRELVNQIHGSLERRVNGGTVFHILFPADDVSEEGRA